jgi:uncharacterized membrane protein
VGSALGTMWASFHREWLLQMSWMQVNLILAVLPGVGASVLYRWWRVLGPLRWALLLAVGLLLPNAPYVVTDLIHLPGYIRWAPSRTDVWAGVLPLFAVLIASGVLSYAFTLHLLRKHMRLAAWPRSRRIATEIVVNVLCALGVALGRITRLNSWDVLHPARLVSGLLTISVQPRAIVLSLAVVLLAGAAVDWVASGAAHSLRNRVHHH